MVCHACGNGVDPGQQFCSSCGASLRGVTDATQVVEAQSASAATADPTEQWAADDPEWASTGAVPIVAAVPAGRTALDDVPEITKSELVVDDDEVWALTSENYAATAPVTNTTAEMPAIVAAGGTGRQPSFHFGFVLVASILTAITGLIGSFATLISVESDVALVVDDRTPAGFRTGTWVLDDLGGNLSITMLVAVALAVIGGVAAGFHWRWGSGLAGGSGLAVAGLVALSIGLAQFPLDTARQHAATSTQQFTLTLTRDVGYWLLIAAAALGVIVFFASLNEAFGDRRPGLNPIIAALGALASVVAAIGPMLPEGNAVFSDNWYLIAGPGNPSGLLVAGRLIQLGLLALTGVVGYLCVKRWGLGLAIGGAMPVVWMAISTLFELTDDPIGPAYRNPGAVDSDLHGMTIIGVSAVVAMAILAVVAAYDQGIRERR